MGTVKPQAHISLKRIQLPQFVQNGILTVFERDPEGVPFNIERVFTITGVPPGEIRADHAHRKCNQLITCLSGKVSVETDDGTDKNAFLLDSNSDAILIPSMTWTRILFEDNNTIVAVFCDLPFDETDYIKKRDEFRALCL